MKQAKEIIKFCKGFKEKPYLSESKVWEIGYGHSRTVRANMEITKEKAEELLEQDLRAVLFNIKNYITVSLTDIQWQSLVVFAFEVGTGNLGRADFIRLLNRGWYQQVPTQMLKWTNNGKVKSILLKAAQLWYSEQVEKQREQKAA